jgi:hypothetical protein
MLAQGGAKASSASFGATLGYYPIATVTVFDSV